LRKRNIINEEKIFLLFVRMVDRQDAVIMTEALQYAQFHVCPQRETNFFNSYIGGGGVQLGPLGTAATNTPIVPALGDYDDEKIGGMIDRGDRSTGRKPAPVPLCPPQTPHAVQMGTRAAAVLSKRLTA
jgi:hypothetical protein